jgi:hypothetical protein
MGIIADTARKLAAEGNSVDVIIAMIESMESGAKPPRKGKDGSPRAELECVLDPTRAQAVLDHRQRTRTALTPYAAKLLAAELAKCEDPNAAADLMIMKGWMSIKAEWVVREMQRNAPVPYNAPTQLANGSQPTALNDLASFYRERADAEQQR